MSPARLCKQSPNGMRCYRSKFRNKFLNREFLRCEPKRPRKPKSPIPARDSFVALVLRPLPSKPTSDRPHQRCAKPFLRSEAAKHIVFLDASTMNEYYTQKMYEDTLDAARKIAYEPTERKRKPVTGHWKHIFAERLELIDFRPTVGPYVPQIIQVLVNAIEENATMSNIMPVFDNLHEYRRDAKRALVQLVEMRHQTDEMKKTAKNLSRPVIILTLRLFLNELGKKPLHFKKAHVSQMVKNPLLDYFLRPNVEVRKIAKSAILSSSRLHVDTLAFLMLHLHHIRQLTRSGPVEKIRLASIYGHLLISFWEKPKLCTIEFGMEKTIESALLEVMMDVCDVHFWNHITMLKIGAAFTNPIIIRKSMRTSTSVPTETTTDKISRSSAGTVARMMDIYSVQQYVNRPKDSKDKTEDSSTTISSVGQPYEKTSSSSSSSSLSPVGEKQSKDKWVLPKISYLSLPVPHVLPFAEISLLDARPGTWKSPSRRTEVSTSLRELMTEQFNPLRRTSRILNDIRTYRIMQLHGKPYNVLWQGQGNFREDRLGCTFTNPNPKIWRPSKF
ncbi:unnamed protein product [Calicophoron daubneyi]|uniref:Rho-GAP domain-containing protein n=1 Tax=Calicophoron daubneyi TaxID=300641 RepID=A0AAV2TD11_CALDB